MVKIGLIKSFNKKVSKQLNVFHDIHGTTEFLGGIIALTVFTLSLMNLFRFPRQYELKQVHSLCVDLRPGDRLQLAKGPPHLFLC